MILGFLFNLLLGDYNYSYFVSAKQLQKMKHLQKSVLMESSLEKNLFLQFFRKRCQ